MAKRRKKRRKPRPTKGTDRASNRPGSLVYVELPSPFAGLSAEERTRRAESMAAEAARRFTKGLGGLQERITAFEPTSLLAHMSFYHLTTWGGVDRELAEAYPILQHHVELVQALALQHASGEFSWMPTFPDIPAFLELLDDTSKAFFLRRMTPRGSDEEQAGALLLERMRVHTHAVRNWGYPDQIARIVTELFRPLDERVASEAGLRIEDLYAMCLRVIEISEERMRDQFKRLEPIARAETLRDAIDAHQRGFPNQGWNVEATEQLLAMLLPGMVLEEAKELLLHHLNLRLPDVFTFGLEDCHSAYPGRIEDQVLRAVLDGWSLSFGDLAGDDAEHFFLGNPVWTRPLIRLDDGKYLCPIPGLFLGFGLELMEEVVRTRTSLTAAYEKRRADYLEEEVTRRFADAFPSGQVWRGSKWSEPGAPDKVYENDVLVRVDTLLIVVEAKAGKVSAPARRGAEKRLKSEIDKLLAAAAEQGARFAEYLRRNPGLHHFPAKGGTNDVDTRGVREIIHFNVTLDQLGDIYSRSEDLRAAGLLSAGAALTPTLTLADLESVFELLDGQVQKAHYLARRAQIERHTDYFAGELDLLDLYLDTEFNIGSLEFDEGTLLLRGRFKKLDPYLMRRSTGTNPPGPQLRMTQWWRDILSRVEERKLPGWIELGMALLNVSSEDKGDLEERFQTTQRTVRRHGHTPEHEDVLYLVSGAPQRPEAVAALAYRGLTREQRNELAERVGYRAMKRAGTGRAAVIAVDVVRRDYPYSAVYLAEGGPDRIADGSATT